MEIGDRIRKIRLKKGLKQSELAKLSNVSRVAIGNYERGDRIPNAEILQSIANALDIPVGELFGVNEEELKKDLTNIEDTEALLKYLGYDVITHPIDPNGEKFEIEIKSNNTSVVLSEDEYNQLKDNIKFILDYELYKLKHDA